MVELLGTEWNAWQQAWTTQPITTRFSERETRFPFRLLWRRRVIRRRRAIPRTLYEKWN